MAELKKGKYRHYKGDFYEVLGTARHSETLEKVVVYRALYAHPRYGRNSLWVRPEKMFREKILHDGKRIPRFQYLKAGRTQRKAA